MIRRLLYVGFAAQDVDRTRRTLGRLLGLPSEPVAADPFLGLDRAARLPFPNGCWLYLMESRQPESPVCQFLQRQGPGLERLVLESDDIKGDFARARAAGAPLPDEALVQTGEGRRFVAPAGVVGGVTVEVLQPASGPWTAPPQANRAGVLGLQHIGVATRQFQQTYQAFERLFGLPVADLRHDQHGGLQQDVVVLPGNDRLWLHVVESWEPGSRVLAFLQEHGQGVDHLCIEVADIRRGVKRIQAAGVPIVNHKIHTDRPDGFEAFVHADHTTGLTFELIEPFPQSRGYRFRRG
ncbi:MAG: hypothetical protein GX605_00130 [Chloroflexi bacterium]|nr:hypothetical protein [Chloroflexota bacterium]